MDYILEVNNLIKNFGKITAVNGVSLALRHGICFGLLGPNGAGKTTTIEILEGIKTPTSGTVLFNNEPLGKAFKNTAGIMFQSTSLQDFITVRETLQLFSSFYPQTTPLNEICQKCALTELLDRGTHQLSGGQRQRLLLAIALVNNPTIIFLDEPTTGLDPQSRRNFWQLVHEIKQQNRTILLTTHYMEEAYELCDEIAIMDMGKIIAQGTPQQLLAEHFNSVIVQLPYSAIEGLQSPLPVALVKIGNDITIETQNVKNTIEILAQHNIALDNIKIRDHTLDDLFLKLTGHQLRI